MESVIVNARAYNKKVSGCQRFERDIMVAMMTPTDAPGKSGMEFNDFFLTTVQAEALVKELQEQLEYNRLCEEETTKLKEETK